MTDLVARLCSFYSHAGPVAGLLPIEAADEIERLRADLANARAAALEEAAVIVDDWGDAREPARGGDALKNCAVDIRAAIGKDPASLG